VVADRFVDVGLVEGVGDVGGEGMHRAVVKKLHMPSVVQIPLEIVPPRDIRWSGSKHPPVLVQLEYPQNRLQRSRDAVTVVYISPIVRNNENQQKRDENLFGRPQPDLGRLSYVSHSKITRLVLKKLFFTCGDPNVDHDAGEIRALARGETGFQMRRRGPVELRFRGLHVITRGGVVDDVVVENERHEPEDLLRGSGAEEEVEWIKNWRTFSKKGKNFRPKVDVFLVVYDRYAKEAVVVPIAFISAIAGVGGSGKFGRHVNLALPGKHKLVEDLCHVHTKSAIWQNVNLNRFGERREPR